MAFQLLINLLIAFTWMFLTNSYDFAAFFAGFLVGLLTIFLLRRFFSHRFYLANVYAVIKLVLLFIKELILSNIAILKIVLKPKFDAKPGIFALPIDVKKDWEITLLSNLITLTPGTLVIDVSDDKKTLYIHAMHVPDVTEAIHSIKGSFEKAIMEVSR